ncbi:hypothetical protein [Candidatus Leptofilum sp.]|uniref:hypothetical protein n=1 Tax=Candidatus Leptofilum sp. TaxID=3241576 RepID=UPI003B59853A
MKQQLSTKNVPHSALHVWLMSFICVVIMVFALATATRLPLYVETTDYVRLLGTLLFNALALVGLADNIHTHYLVWQRRHHAKHAKLATQI